jgi:hypothetical protein
MTELLLMPKLSQQPCIGFLTNQDQTKQKCGAHLVLLSLLLVGEKWIMLHARPV